MRAAMQPEADLDERVGHAFTTWDNSHRALLPLRTEYDRAMQLYERRDGPDPMELRGRIKAAQGACDELFFQLLKAAEVRTRERYI